VAALVDTNILVYRYDLRFPEKQRIATDLLCQGIALDSVRVPHQAIFEFVAVVTRPLISGRPLLEPNEARREAEEFLSQFTVLYPTEGILRLALRATAAYGLSWFDAHL
jgi:predicted nucleic acid-binding protein